MFMIIFYQHILITIQKESPSWP